MDPDHSIEADGLVSLGDLPLDVVSRICQLCDLGSLAALGRCSKALDEVASDAISHAMINDVSTWCGYTRDELQRAARPTERGVLHMFLMPKGDVAAFENHIWFSIKTLMDNIDTVPTGHIILFAASKAQERVMVTTTTDHRWKAKVRECHYQRHGSWIIQGWHISSPVSLKRKRGAQLIEVAGIMDTPANTKRRMKSIFKGSLHKKVMENSIEFNSCFSLIKRVPRNIIDWDGQGFGVYSIPGAPDKTDKSVGCGFFSVDGERPQPSGLWNKNQMVPFGLDRAVQMNWLGAARDWTRVVREDLLCRRRDYVF